jgi:acyl carrier protein
MKLNRETILNKLIIVFREFFQNESLIITENTTNKDIEDWDSVSHIQLIFEIEEAFDVQFEAEDIAGLDSVEAIVDEVSCGL